MEQTGVIKLAKVLKVLVTLVFICNLFVLPLVPGLVCMGAQDFAAFFHYDADDAIKAFIRCTWHVWGANPNAILALFLSFCGVCTAIILWQARGVLGTVVRKNTFTIPNAKRMKTAAICCFLIGGAALLRTIWGFFYFASIQPLFTYNTVFCPLFVMGGLLSMVMSALFRQAAELKEENDLTI